MGRRIRVRFISTEAGVDRSDDSEKTATWFNPVMDMALASWQSYFPKFEQFLWYHWDYPKTQFPNPNAYCDRMMWKLGLYGKPKHIFIHEPIQKIIDICRGGGIPLGGGWYKSKQFFHITKCTFNCMLGHYTSLEMFVKIIVKCINGFPVAIQCRVCP